jgi:hypothetical protein
MMGRILKISALVIGLLFQFPSSVLAQGNTFSGGGGGETSKTGSGASAVVHPKSDVSSFAVGGTNNDPDDADQATIWLGADGELYLNKKGAGLNTRPADATGEVLVLEEKGSADGHTWSLIMGATDLAASVSCTVGVDGALAADCSIFNNIVGNKMGGGGQKGITYSHRPYTKISWTGTFPANSYIGTPTGAIIESHEDALQAANPITLASTTSCAVNGQCIALPNVVDTDAGSSSQSLPTTYQITYSLTNLADSATNDCALQVWEDNDHTWLLHDNTTNNFNPNYYARFFGANIKSAQSAKVLRRVADPAHGTSFGSAAKAVVVSAEQGEYTETNQGNIASIFLTVAPGLGPVHLAPWRTADAWTAGAGGGELGCDWGVDDGRADMTITRISP